MYRTPVTKTSLLAPLLLFLASCASQTAEPAPAGTSPQVAVTEPSAEAMRAVQKAPSRLRSADGQSKVSTFATYYRVPDGPTLTRLARRDLSIVQPNIGQDQMRALQTTGNAAVYLSIGELGVNNLYDLNGQPVTGSVIYAQHLNDGWFVGKNGNFGSYLLDLTRPDVRDFVVQQGQILLNRQFDGLFLDTADDAELFDTRPEDSGKLVVSGVLELYASRPDYPSMRRAYIGTVKALRALSRRTLLIQNGGFDLLLDRQNPDQRNRGDGTQGYVDAVMHEVAITKSNKPSPTADDAVWPSDPANYESWEHYYARIGGAQAQQDRSFRKNRDDLALEYFNGGGVVLQQDFALPANVGLQCLSYAEARRQSGGRSGWLVAYSDASFNQLFDFVETSPQVRAVPGCESYDKLTEPDYDLSFSPPSLGTAPGRAASTTLNIGQIGGYSGTVELSLGRLPAGVRGSLSAASVVPGPRASVGLTLNTDASLAAGTYIIPVKARSQGQSMSYDLRLSVYRTQGDSVWVAQAGTGEVLAFDSSAALNSATVVSRNTGRGSLRQPYAVAIDGNGASYVSENVGVPGSRGQGRVLRYSAFGIYPGGETGTIGGLDFPTALALDAQNRLWVVQSGLNFTGKAEGTPRVSRFDPVTLKESTGFTLSPNLGFPAQVAVQGDTLWLTTSFGLLLRYDVTAEPTLISIYTLNGQLNAFGGVTAAGDSLWLSGTDSSTGNGAGSSVSRAVRLNPAALPAGTNLFAVDGSAAITLTLSRGLYDPAGIGQDSLGNVWVVNKTGAAGVAGTNAADHGTLNRFPASSLSSTNPVPDLSLDLGSRYPVGLAVAKP